MAKLSPQKVTQLPAAWSHGDQKALEQLIPLAYAELHRLARRYMSQERSGHPLQMTALVNEVYLRLIHTQHISLDEKFGLSEEKSADPALRGRQLYPVPMEVDSPMRCAAVAGCAGVFSAHSSSDNFRTCAKRNR